MRNEWGIRGKKGQQITIEEAIDNLKSLFKNLQDAGYKLHEIYALNFKDVDLLISINEPEEKLTTIDKILPGLF
ncbi:hypothetical protein [Listeria booriae]|uniref:hypothetical protein n=1 Tax=Listeria booriae TaxID=1552123 RepID=UPI001623824E|nr:hypothetical protein [Listeria booriae]MBC2067028.1 hypothetical protein [Listeria booriae]